MVYRLRALIAGVLIAYLGLVLKLYDLQIENGQYYLARAAAQGDVLKAERGAIFFTDRNGNQIQVATNKGFPLVYAVPKMIEDPLEAAHEAADILGVPAEELVERFSKPDDDYELLARKASREVASRAAGLERRGIYVQDSPERFYPFGRLAAHLLGFVGPDEDAASESGKYGVEKFYNGRLSGVSGKFIKDEIVPPTSGEHLALTLDPSIQKESERILEDLVGTHNAKGGSVIVEDPKTGKMLAMASLPGFDPNRYQDAEIRDFLNPVTQEIYEPGSVFKVITMAAGIDAGKITPETTFYDNGSLVVSGRKIQNWDLKAHGTITMTNVLEKSVNTGAVFAERATGDATFTAYLARFGFGEETGIDLPGEIKGDLRRLHPKAPAVAFATASFGQGVAVTPIELVNAVAAIANGGTLMRPYVNAGLGPKAVREVISAASAKTVAQMMVSAVDKAEVAKVARYSFAGKTGTAQVPDFRKGGYTENVINTYVGFGPTADPRFVILIKLNEPEGAPVAGLTVVPAFRDLAQFIVNYYNIPPDRL